MKKYLSFFLCFLLVLSIFTACSANADAQSTESFETDLPSAGLPNPIVDCQSTDEINAIVGCNMKSIRDSYIYVTDESFSYIKNTDSPIAQYRFKLDSIPVCIRAAVTSDDISGIYMEDGKHPWEFLPEDDPYAIIDTGYGVATRWFDGGMQYSIDVGNDSGSDHAMSENYGSLEDIAQMLRDFLTYRDMPWYQFEEIQGTDDPGNILGYRKQIQDWNLANGKSFGTGMFSPYSSLKNFTVENSKNTVEVSDIDSFLKSIAPDTEIRLAAGTYLLTEASDYGNGSSEYYHWEETYDGYELVIENADNLSITGAFLEAEDGVIRLETEFITSPRYSEIIRFKRCSDLTLSGSVFGHTEEGECAGGVLAFEICNNVKILGCELYGCGVTGIDGLNCKNMEVRDVIIHDCSYMHTDLNSCNDILFSNCSFLANYGYGGANMFGCTNITFENSDFAYNTVNQIFNAEGTDNVNVRNCFMLYNETAAGLFSGDDHSFQVDGGACVEYSTEDGQYNEIAFG